MAATDLEICNLALDNIGVTNKVASISAPATKEEKACARWYAHSRDFVLRAFPWPFASRSETLVLAVPEILHLRWQYVYDLPATFFKARRVFVEGQARNDLGLPFEVELDPTGTKFVLLCDSATAALEFTRKFDSNALVALLPPPFVDAVAWHLASKVVTPLALKKELISEALQMYRNTVLAALGIEMAQGKRDDPADAPWVQARG